MSEVDEKVDRLTNVDADQNIPPLSVREEKQPTPMQSKKKSNIVAVALILVIGYLVLDNAGSLTNIDLFPDDIPEGLLDTVDVCLYQFNDLVDNDSVNVELWVINIGEVVAKDIEVYIRVRDHNGTIVESGDLSMTALVLRENETCSGTYEIDIGTAEYFTHTVEISWFGGRNTYSKETIII